MLPYQERVVEEKVELDVKIEGLSLFIKSESSAFTSLPHDEQERLQYQLIYMKGYSKVLGERISNFR